MRDDIATEPTYIRRFLREAANAGLIDHQNVVAIHEVGAVSGRVYFTMDLVQGQTLKDRLAAGPLSETEGLEVLRQISAGLVAAHERGIGHRDLKPSNIMLADARSKYGFTLKDESAIHVKIMDFGLARMYLDDDEPEVDAEGRILGTAKYVAPELVEGKTPTLQADVFSLGIMAFQMFAGRSPWKAKNKIEYLEANVRAATPDLSATAPGISAETSRLVTAMLEKDPEKRPTTKALVRDVGRILAHLGKPVATQLAVPDDPESVFYPRRGEKKAAPRPGMGALTPGRAAAKPVAILGAVVALLVVIALCLWLLRGSPESNMWPPRPEPGLHVDTSGPPSKLDTSVPIPAADEELVLGKRPSSLLALAAQVKTPLERAQLQKRLDTGDQAWADGDAKTARDQWKEALGLVASSPPLERRISFAERLVALDRAKAAEAEGKTQDAIDALDIAVAKGVPPGQVSEARARLVARLADEQETRDATAEAAAATARGEFDAARDRLEAARAAFSRLGRDEVLASRLKEVREARTRRSDAARLAKLLQDAKELIESGSLEAAQAALDSARAIDPNGATAASLQKRLARVKATPRGAVCIELGSDKGLYVGKEPVSNRAYKEWLSSLPIGKRRTAPWLTGDFAPEDAEKPVKNVKPEDARAFAEARGERLPVASEREAISRELKGFTRGENVPDGRGLYSSGFRTVSDPHEDKP
jgi:serine/threonine protein kinase